MSFKKMLKKQTAKKVKVLDVDSDEIIAEATQERVRFLPRACYEGLIELVYFAELETDTGVSIGWEAYVRFLEVVEGKENPAFDPPPSEGAMHTIRFRKAGAKPWIIKNEIKLLRLFICAACGVEHTDEVKVSTLRDQLIHLSENEELSNLDPFILSREAWVKEKEEDGKIYVNTADTFSVTE